MASKKELATELFKKLVEEGVAEKDMRKTFIARAQLAPLNMTPAGASTYYVNAKNESAGVAPKNYYKPASERKVSQATDDSKENAPLWSVAVVDDLKKGNGKFSGVVNTCHSFMNSEAAVKRFQRLNPALRDRCVVVEGAPAEGVDLATCKVIAH